MSHIEHITLLTEVEVEELYARPCFNNNERDGYFLLEDADWKLLDQYKSLKSKIYFILQLGYFRASQQFYSFTLEAVQDDVNYVVGKYFSAPTKSLTGAVWKEIYRQQKNAILKCYGYRQWSNEYRPLVIDHLLELIRLYPKGNDTLHKLWVFLEKEQIIIPSYRTLQDLFTKVFSLERERLDAAINTIPKALQQQLDAIIKNEGRLSELNNIRSDQKDFCYSAIKTEIEKSRQIKTVYELSQTMLPNLQISNNAVRYYALLAEHYIAARTRKLKKSQQYFQVMCFISHRYKTFMDNLITSFLLHMRTLMDDATTYAKTKEAEYIANVTLDLPKLVTFLNWFSADNIAPDIAYAVFSKEAFDILPKDKQSELAKFIAGIAFDQTAAKWEYYQKASRRIAMYLRSIMLVVDFEYYQPDSFIMELITVLREHYGAGRSPKNLIVKLSDTLLEKIAPRDLALLKNGDDPETIHPSRFEVYVYKKMLHLLDRGRLYCNESVSYCSLDHDLIDDKLVDNAPEIAAQFGYPNIATYCDDYLDDKLAQLEAAWQCTNANIQNGTNKGIKIDVNEEGTSTWSLSYDTEPSDRSTFFSETTPIEVADIMQLMGDKLNVWPAFTHLKDRYVKQKQPPTFLLVAGLLAKAFGFSAKKMAEISNVDYHQLCAIDEDFMYVENLCQANDIVSNYIHSLPVTRTWDLKENMIIGDADGQKFGTRHHTVQSRYSSKYFGTYKGISVYSLVANYIPINSKIIGPNEHESHHLYDVLYNNHSDVIVEMVTGDNHSRNQANHVVLDSVNVAYIPSIKHIRKEAEKLYSVNDPADYNGLIKPRGKINVDLIRSEKRGIVRILLSLLLQENTQPVIIRKLASHKRYSRLRAALWEYNKIFHSIHMLNLINNSQLRKIIKRARNRTESYHQLQSAVRKVHNGVFRGKRIINNAVINQASRLVTNLIIAYNAMLLDQVYHRLVEKVGKERADKIMARISPIAWDHLIFTGRYNFKGERGNIDVDKLIALLEEKLGETL